MIPKKVAQWYYQWHEEKKDWNKGFWFIVVAKLIEYLNVQSYQDFEVWDKEYEIRNEDNKIIFVVFKLSLILYINVFQSLLNS